MGLCTNIFVQILGEDISSSIHNQFQKLGLQYHHLAIQSSFLNNFYIISLVKWPFRVLDGCQFAIDMRKIERSQADLGVYVCHNACLIWS
jgi:hypothetical protein